MARYTEQIERTRAAHMAARAISDAATVRLTDSWNDFEAGIIDIDDWALEARKTVRFSYRESAKIARILSREMAELPGWEPEPYLKNSDYLRSLLLDVERNVRTFKESDQSDKAKRNLKLRVELSSVTAAERGFTDSQLKHYGELVDMGYRVSKMWLANFVNNDPCVSCRALHNIRVPFQQEFPVPTLMRTAIYRDLQGPPLHVRCKCVMVVLITRAENLLERIPTETITPSNTMTTEMVKRLPKRIFNSIVNVLKMITGRRRDA